MSMRLFLVLNIFLFLSTSAICQQAYNIHYRGTINGMRVQLRLIFNDSTSFTYFYEGKDPHKKDTLIDGKASSPHSNFFSNNSFSFQAKRGKNKLLVIDTLKYRHWILGSDTKIILGYNCNSAYSIGGERDTVFVFFSTELKHPFGPTDIAGAPGVVLEAASTKTNTYWIAEKIERTAILLAPPKEGMLITREYFQKYYL